MRRLTISLAEAEYKQVARLAESEERSLNWVICKAVREYLEKWAPAQQIEIFRRRRKRS